jgi:hypothetical protein
MEPDKNRAQKDKRDLLGKTNRAERFDFALLSCSISAHRQNIGGIIDQRRRLGGHNCEIDDVAQNQD